MKRLTLLACSVAACSWTQFDDLSNTTWAHAVEKPTGTVASDFGIALLPAAPSQSRMGGRLAVLGVGSTSLDVIEFDASGNTASLFFEDKVAESGILQFPDQPLFIKPRTTQLADEVAIVIAPGDTSIRILLGQGFASDQPVVPQTPITVGGTTALSLMSADAATYMIPPAATTEQLLVASASTVIGVDRTTGAKTPCILTDDTGTMTVSIAALAAFPITAAADQIAVWTKTGKLFIYSPNIYNGCTMGDATSKALNMAADTAFMPGTGARIHVATATTGTLLLLASRQGGASGGPNTAMSRAVAYTVPVSATPTPAVAGSPLDKDGLHASAVATLGGMQYAILGFPQESVNGTVAGSAFLHALDATTGLAMSPSLTLNRAQPDANGSYGRAVSTMSYNGQTILAVGANNNVFVYYRLSPIYEDARPL